MATNVIEIKTRASHFRKQPRLGAGQEAKDSFQHNCLRPSLLKETISFNPCRP